MKVSRKWIEWVHEPAAESGVEASERLCILAKGPGTGSVEIIDPGLIAELVSVAECYRSPARGTRSMRWAHGGVASPKRSSERAVRLFARNNPLCNYGCDSNYSNSC